MKRERIRTEQQWRLYCELELIDWNESGLEFSKPKLKAAFEGIGRYLKEFLTPIEEPQIEEIVNRNGETQWQVYDPTSDRTFRLNSPQEVSAWLENRRSAAPAFF